MLLTEQKLQHFNYYKSNYENVKLANRVNWVIGYTTCKISSCNMYFCALYRTSSAAAYSVVDIWYSVTYRKE